MGFFSAPPAPQAPVYIAQPAPQPQPIPTVQEVAAPTVDNSAAEIAKAQEAELTKLKKQKGRASTILSSGDDAETAGGVATKKLLGA